MEKSRN